MPSIDGAKFFGLWISFFWRFFLLSLAFWGAIGVVLGVIEEFINISHEPVLREALLDFSAIPSSMLALRGALIAR